jgi:hypothetical protein
MFDTVVFNRILDGALDIGAFVGKARFYATHIQLDEINETSNSQRRQALLEVFNRITERKVPTESFVLGVSRLDEARWGAGILSRRNQPFGMSRPGVMQNGAEQTDSIRPSRRNWTH